MKVLDYLCTPFRREISSLRGAPQVFLSLLDEKEDSPSGVSFFDEKIPLW